MSPTDLEPPIQAHMHAHADRLSASGSARSPAVTRAFRQVPRHLFVESFFMHQPGNGFVPVAFNPLAPTARDLEVIYSGDPIVTHLHGNLSTSSASQTGLVAVMLERLDLRPGMRILEIGTGTGYNAALLAELVGDPTLVTTVDCQPDVVARAQRAFLRAGCSAVRMLLRDGFHGVPEFAPYDRVIVTVSCPDLAPAWVKQLDPSGLILFPLRHAGADPLIKVRRQAGQIIGQVTDISRFMAPQGRLFDDMAYTGVLLDSAYPVERKPLWEELRIGAETRPSWSKTLRSGFWFHLGIRDPRSRMFQSVRTFGLLDQSTGQNQLVAIDGDEIILRGEQRLFDDLEALYHEWRGLGSPRMEDYTVEFHELVSNTPTYHARPSWTMQGRDFRRTFAPAGERIRA